MVIGASDLITSETNKTISIKSPSDISDPVLLKTVAANPDAQTVIYTGKCPSKIVWKDISGGQEFINIAANLDSDAVWAIRYKTHGTGNAIAKYDPTKKEWVEDFSIPAGAWSIAVDSK